MGPISRKESSSAFPSLSRTVGLMLGFVIVLDSEVGIAVGDAVGVAVAIGVGAAVLAWVGAIVMRLRLEVGPMVGLELDVMLRILVVGLVVELDGGNNVVGIPVEEVVGVELGESEHIRLELHGITIRQEHDPKIGSWSGKHGCGASFAPQMDSSVTTTSITTSLGSPSDS
eukprot:CAMPEP_0116143528 /NCGR_PEP_ID=MMETSP0329-20121206/15501_1 /TAXON_ID=697910 /ORGANISM="Pseudo-nitzschia arenysensis, Strain B593" /LENGTH=170 /DNA_ID=CAMNT_0003638859 /DNA_START=436 /DNA_END=948 /DNA_ORIENTATION=-